MTTDAGPVPIIKSRLQKDDLFATFFVRCGIGRHSYTVAPGLYGIGNPDKNSEVLVTANFKLTFDHLRKELSGIHAWILVLDTKGVNVWCAAGKGTFSTGELVKRIKTVSLEKVVNHKRVILPQLGATGVSAREVKKLSGFRVIYGPVRAKDIPAFLKNDKTADKPMRQVTFSLYERFILTPVEIRIVLKPALIFVLVLFILSGFGPGIFSFSGALERGLLSFYALATGIISGAFVTPVLLPYIPSRHFALKGIISGSIFAGLLLLLSASDIPGISGSLALFFFSVTVSSYLAMNFTGATPFTSPSGVEKEMKRYIPVQLAGLVISSGLWIYSAF
ncbi:MAG: hypothetical protein A2277_08340 [Desulfobacterales bacterium RIFOXYA12_FULL_46_15]|nr:MAG: hypothetical protein A2277_08340 [Desulfobacterales bacterium RIFOXYA12_FULL_46_15]